MALLSALIVIIALLFCKYKNNHSNTTYNIPQNSLNSLSFHNPLYDADSKNSKQSSNGNSNSSLNGEDTISSRTRSKTRRAYESQSSITNGDDATEMYDDVVYQEETGLGYIDEDEEQIMTSTNPDGTINVYEDDVDDTYVDSDLIGGASSRKTKKSRSGSSLEFSEAWLYFY